MDRVILVMYNDRYGNGNKSIEGYVTSEKEFKKWLKSHNERRVAEGDEPEGAEEFDLIELKNILNKEYLSSIGKNV